MCSSISELVMFSFGFSLGYFKGAAVPSFIAVPFSLLLLRLFARLHLISFSLVFGCR